MNRKKILWPANIPSILLIILSTIALPKWSVAQPSWSVAQPPPVMHNTVRVYTFPFNPGNSLVINRKHNYTIVYPDNTTIEVKAILNVYDSVNTLNWGKNEKEFHITPSETKQIFHEDGVVRKVGIPVGNSWGFIVDTGTISTYSVTSELDVPLIGYARKGKGGAFVTLTAENIKELVSDDPKSLYLVKKGKLLRAIEGYNKRTR